MKGERYRAYRMFVASMLIFGSVGVARHYITWPSALIASLRGFIGAAVLMLYVLVTKRKPGHGMEHKTLFLLVLTGAMIGGNWMLLFEAYRYTSVPIATLCYYMQPTLVILLAPFFFREKLTLKRILCVLLSVFGMVLVSGVCEEGRTTGIKGILFGLGAAGLYAIVVICNKKIQTEDVYGKTVIQLLSAAAVTLPYGLLSGGTEGVVLTPVSVLMAFVMGIIHTGLAYLLYFRSMKHLPAQSMAILSYIDPVSALVLSGIILGESLSGWSILGAVIILGAAVWGEWPQKTKKSGRE